MGFGDIMGCVRVYIADNSALEGQECWVAVAVLVAALC